MKDYSKLGYGPRMIKTDSRVGTRDYTTALEDSMRQEPTPYLHETAISKGTFQTTLGGLTEFKDSTGGTTIFTYNPDTGVVTIIGSLVANQVSTGTYSNIVLSGTPTLSGTLAGGVHNNATFGTPALVGGTSTNMVVNAPTIGSPQITNGTMNNGVFGTPAITGGTHSAGVLANNTIGTPAVTGGTYNSGVFGTPTITAGTFTNKLNVATGANQSVGLGTLASGIATISTTAVAANSIILATARSSNANLGILSAGSITAGTSFVVRSSNILDDDVFAYWLIN